jgi:predicted PurR-regulated permease PerM
MKAIVLRVNLVLLLLVVSGLLMYSQLIQAGDNLQDKVIGELNTLDEQNQDLLDQVIDSANSSLDSNSNVTMDEGELDEMGNETGGISWGGEQQEADISGTGGVALIEHAKDQQQTAVSNINSVMANMNQTKKIIQRNIGGQ